MEIVDIVFSCCPAIFFVLLIAAVTWFMYTHDKRRIKKDLERSAKPLPENEFFEEFYKHHIQGKGFMSNVELSKTSRSYLVRIFTGELEVNISWLPNDKLGVHTFYQDPKELPFDITQGDAPSPNPTGDDDFDRRFCVGKGSKQPSAPIREVLKRCADLGGHQNVSLQGGGIVSVIDNSIDVPFADLVTLHCDLFKAYAQSPDVLDVYAEHREVARTVRR